MTTTEQAYNKFILKINKNATTDGISCDKGRFVLIFNEAQNKFIEHILDKKFEDDIRYIQQILVDDKEISPSATHLDHQDFELPKDFLDLSTVYGFASRDKCNKQKISLFEIKDDNRNEIMRDEFNKPSFKFREAPYHLSSNFLKVYKDDFKYTSLRLSYYRYPIQIGLINQDNPEGNFNSQNPEWDDKTLDRIITLAASEFEFNNESQKYQATKVNAAQKI